MHLTQPGAAELTLATARFDADARGEPDPADPYAKKVGMLK